MIPFAKEKGILATAVAIAGSALAGQRATLDACDLNSHCYAYARTQGLIVDGVAARYNVTNVGVPDINQGGFVNQALWAGYNNAPPIDDWIEVGWIKWRIGGNGYHHYWVHGYYDENGQPHGQVGNIDSIPIGGIGASHHYQLVRVNDGLYRAYIDNQQAKDFSGVPYTLWGQVGLEYTSDNSEADVNEPRELQWRHAGNLTWHSWGAAGTVGGYEIGPRSHWQWNPGLPREGTGSSRALEVGR